MLRLSLIIADKDQQYVEKLSDYVRVNHSTRLQVSSFSSVQSLKDFFKSTAKADILLVAPEFVDEEIKRLSPELVFILSSPSATSVPQGYPIINKYQPADKLITQVIELCSDRHEAAASVFQGSNQTRVISVYSPCGGTGKTVTAVNLAIQLSSIGRSVFYLNLETMNSGAAFFQSTHGRGLSHVLINLDEGQKILSVKIEAAKCHDSISGVDYFQPAESCIELSELNDRGLLTLINTIRQMGTYDFIIVDTESSLDERNIALFGQSDKVVLLAVQDQICINKIKVMFDEFDRLNLNIKPHLIAVANKSPQNFQPLQGIETEINIPYLQGLLTADSYNQRTDFNSMFSEHIMNLARIISH